VFFACIFVPDFPVEARLRAEPELRSQAVVILEGTVPLQKVFAVNEKARHAGVDPGMSKIQIEACPGLVLRARSLLQETAAHAALVDCAQSFSPRVEDTAHDTILLDLSGLETLFGTPAKIARAMARLASDLGLEANVAVASNPDTTLLAARGFSGITVIPSGREDERLGSLSLDVLFGLPANDIVHLETLRRWGVRNLRALAALPEVPVSERLGQSGVRLQQLARGATSRTLVPVDPPQVFEEVIELDYPLLLLEPLAFLLARMLEHLCHRLSSHALCTQELHLQLELDPTAYQEDLFGSTDEPASKFGAMEENSATPAAERRKNAAHGASRGSNVEPAEAPEGRKKSYTSFQRTLHLPVPLLDPRVFLKLLQLDLNAHPPGAPIVKIHLSAEPARPRSAQGGLFLPPSPDPEKLEVTLARIAGIVGEDKVGSLALLDTHRPEAFRMQHFAPPSPDENYKTIAETKSAVTAMRILRPPAVAIVTLHDSKPAKVACPKRKEISGEVLWTAGPWRFSGDWWGQDGWARDEWDIALELKFSVPSSQFSETRIALYRLVHDLLAGKWFVEGTYD
jgi:protein ImuB